MSVALGVGLTSACTFSCRHCYSGGGRDPVEMDTGSLFRFLSVTDVDSVNLGTGESCLHPEFHTVLMELHRRAIPVALTTAGPSVKALSDGELSRMHDIDFSLDFPEATLHDEWRASGAFDMVMKGLERCRKLGVTSSVAMCLMEQNAACMEDMCRLCGDLGVSLRVNVYKPVSRVEYQASYDSFWRAVDTLFRCSARAVSSEPVVNAALSAVNGNAVFNSGGSPCGVHSMRLRPDGTVLPCVYWNRSPLKMDDFRAGRAHALPSCTLPAPGECQDCPHLDICQGGCAGRRLYTGSHRPDIYCFLASGRETPTLATPEPLTGHRYIHAAYLCTIIAEFC